MGRLTLTVMVLCVGLVSYTYAESKGMLQHFCQKNKIRLPEYSRSFDSWAERFYSTVTVDGQTFESVGSHKTGTEADQDAATVALRALGQIREGQRDHQHGGGSDIDWWGVAGKVAQKLFEGDEL